MSVPLFVAGLTMVLAAFFTSVAGDGFCVLTAAVSALLLLIYCLTRFTDEGEWKEEGIEAEKGEWEEAEPEGKEGREREWKEAEWEWEGKNAPFFSTTLIVLISLLLFSLSFLLKLHFSYNRAVKLAEQNFGRSLCISGRVVKILPAGGGGTGGTGSGRGGIGSGSGGKKNKICILKLSQLRDESGKTIKIPAFGLKLKAECKGRTPKINELLSFKGRLFVAGGTVRESVNYSRSRGCYLKTYLFQNYKVLRGYEDFSPETHKGLSIFERALYLSASLSEGLRELIRNKVSNYLPERFAGAALALLSGDKSLIEEGDAAAFREAGVIHLFSISGFHTALWSGIVFRLSLRAGLRKRSACVLCALSISAYVALTGFSYSALRAGLMLVIYFCGRFFYKDSDSLNSLGAAAVLILLLNPFAGGDTGFLLSFFATLGICTLSAPFARPLKLYLKRIPDYVQRDRAFAAVDLFAVSLSAFIFTAPILLMKNYGLSFVSPVSNLFISPAACLLLPLLGLCCFFSLLLPFDFICRPLFLAAGLLLKYIFFASEYFARCGGFADLALSDGDRALPKILLAAVLLLFAFSFLLRREEKAFVPYYKIKEIPTARELLSYYRPENRLLVLLSLIVVLGGIFARFIVLLLSGALSP